MEFDYTLKENFRVTGGAWCQAYFMDLKDWHHTIWSRESLDAPQLLPAGASRHDQYVGVVSSYIWRDM